MIARPRTVREWLCDTGDVSDTRIRVPRPCGPFAPTAAPTAAVAGERQDLAATPTRQIMGLGRGLVVPLRAARGSRIGCAEFGGGAAGAGAWGGSRGSGEEV